MTIGSKGSSVPEMVMPRGPPRRISSTVKDIVPLISGSSVEELRVNDGFMKLRFA